MECANCETHGVAATECMSERISDQFARESCSERRSETHSVVAAVRKPHALHAPCEHQQLVRGFKNRAQ
eukprot:5250039-Lingulodinium_polyedra.AAC.1